MWFFTRRERELRAVLVMAVSLLGPEPVTAQTTVERLWSECAEGEVARLGALCADAALALQALHGGVGLQMTAGGALPASPSTAGHRMEGSPRIVIDVGGTWATFSHPDLSSSGAQSAISDDRSFLVGARLTTVVGIFDGFSPRPALGGVLAVDAVGSLQLIRAPASPGSPGSAVGWGGGVRVGVFRESFSLPGVTVSGLYHGAGELQFGTIEETGALAVLKPSVTSVRTIVGKDLWPLGLSAGVGWDRYRGDGRIEARLSAPSAPGPISARTGPRQLSMNRRYLFWGGNFTWLITQIAVEVTWAREGSPIADLEGTGPFRPGGAELQGALTFRVIY